MWKFVRPNINNVTLIIKACESGNLFNSYVRCSAQICNLRQKSTCPRSPMTLSSALIPESTIVTARRLYAKRTKDSGKKAKQQLVKIDLNDPEVMEIADLDKMKSQMENTLKHFNKELTEQLVLRVTLETVGAVEVETEDGNVNLCDIAQLQQKGQVIVVGLAQYPQYASKAKTAIIKSGINVTPQIDGSSLFLPLQKVTREHREKLAKSAKTICDRCKDKLRNVQNNFLKDAKSCKASHSEDLIKEVQDYITLQTKNFAAEADKILAAKQKDIMNN